MKKRKLIKDLEFILEKNIDETLFPYKKGNSIRIGHIAIRQTPKDYIVFNCKTNSMVARTFCKSSAVALARTLATGKDFTSRILDLDNVIQKNYIDCIFYKHIIAKTTDDVRREITQTRYEIARHRTQMSRSKLDRYIFF